MSLMSFDFGESFPSPSVLDAGSISFDPLTNGSSPLENFTVTQDLSAGTRGEVSNGSGGLFSGLGDFFQDSFNKLAGAGVNRLQAEILDFTRESVDKIERDSYGSLKNQDTAQLEQDRAVAVAKQEAARRSLTVGALIVAGFLGLVLMMRR